MQNGPGALRPTRLRAPVASCGRGGRLVMRPTNELLVFGGYPAGCQVLVVRGSRRTGVSDFWFWYQERAQPGWGVSSAVW